MLGKQKIVCQVCGKKEATKLVAGCNLCNGCFDKMNGISKGDPDSLLFFGNADVQKTLPPETQKYVRSLLEANKGYENAQALADRRERDAIRNVNLTMTDTFETKSICRYMGTVTGVCALGTGWFTETAGNITDALGTQSVAFQNKVIQARQAAELQMQKEAYEKGADSVVTVRYSYLTGRNNMTVVTVNGTAVCTNEKPRV